MELQVVNGDMIKTPTYTIDNNYNWVVLIVVGPDGKDLTPDFDLKDAYLVIHPPQRNDQIVNGALQYLTGTTTRERGNRNREQWVRHFPTFPKRDEKGTVLDNSLALQFRPLRAESGLVFHAELHAEGKKLGECRIVVSVEP